MHALDYERGIGRSALSDAYEVVETERAEYAA